MPYIPEDRRMNIILGEDVTNNPGELCFAIYEHMVSYGRRHDATFETLNAIIGAAENAKLEFYRRHVAPYEDIKREQNGDV